MSARLTRKEMKRDEVLESLGGFVGFISRNAKVIVLALVGVIVLALVGAGYRAVAESKSAKAAVALGGALDIYSARLDADAPDPDNATDPSFADADARTARARELFEQVADDYAGTDSADIAHVYLGSIAAEGGDLDSAREQWERFVDRQSKHVLALEVRLNLMALDRAQGGGSELVDELRAELAAARSQLPEEVLLHQLAVTLESLDRSAEAVEIYQRLVQEYPQSAYSRTASERIAALESTSGAA